MGGKRQANVQHDADNPMPMPIPEGAFAEEERYMINGVLTLASRSLRGIMTPRGEISWVDANLGVDEIREQLLSSPHSLFPVCRGELDEIIGIVRAKELLVALEEGVDVAAIASASPAIIVPETLDPINPAGRAASCSRELCYRDQRVWCGTRLGHAAGCAGSHCG